MSDKLIVILFSPLWLPMMAIVALLVCVKEGRPILFCQERAGKDCKPFLMYKFRTMRNGEGSDAERMTRFGAWLRKTSLDELPELINVLKGEMALVGPRPLPTRYVPRYTAEQRHRHDVKGGITGWAQVNGRNALSWEEKFRYDLEYVRRKSFWLDVKILAMTVGQVIFPRNIAHAGEATMSEFMGTAK